MTARTLITASLSDLGVFAQGETLGAAEAQDGLRRLNNLVSSWRTQNLTVLAIERQVFPLVANQQTYSIGLGGDFNVPRPQSVNGAGLWLNALTSAVSITIARVGTVATVTKTAHGVSVGDLVYIHGTTQIAYNGMQTVATVPTANTYTYAVFGAPVTPATGSPTMATVNGDATEIPRAMLTDDAYQAIQLKQQTNAQFTNVYYNPTQPLGTIWLWPCPDTAQNQLVLYLQSQFAGFADLTTDYTFPDVAGYAEALQYQLDLRLASPYGTTVPDDIRALARTSLGLVKRQNYKMTDLPTDPALTANRIGGYNINTGQGG